MIIFSDQAIPSFWLYFLFFVLPHHKKTNNITDICVVRSKVPVSLNSQRYICPHIDTFLFIHTEQSTEERIIIEKTHACIPHEIRLSKCFSNCCRTESSFCHFPNNKMVSFDPFFSNFPFSFDFFSLLKSSHCLPIIIVIISIQATFVYAFSFW